MPLLACQFSNYSGVVRGTYQFSHLEAANVWPPGRTTCKKDCLAAPASWAVLCTGVLLWVVMVCRSVVILEVGKRAQFMYKKLGCLTTCCACAALQRAQGTPAEPQVTVVF